MNISRFFIFRPVATLPTRSAIVLLGLLGYNLLPVAPLPQVDFPTIMVSASLPGASPETMAATVATPLERAMGSISGVSEMTSSSSQGSTRIVLHLTWTAILTVPHAMYRRQLTPRVRCCRAACLHCRPIAKPTPPMRRL